MLNWYTDKKTDKGDIIGPSIGQGFKINLFSNTPNQPPKLRTKNCVEKNDDAQGTYSTNSQIKFKTAMLKSSSYDYSDVYATVKWTITVVGVGATASARTTDIEKKQVILKNHATFTDCIIKINNKDTSR